MAATTKIYYVVNDNYTSELNTDFDLNWPSQIIYKQRGSNLDTNMIIFKENDLPIPDVFPDAPSIAYPIGYVGDTIHPSVDGWDSRTLKFIVTMASTIDVDRHPKFYVATSEEELFLMLSKLFPNISTANNDTQIVIREFLNELYGPGNGYLTYNNFLHPGTTFPLTQSDSIHVNPKLVLDPFFLDCWGGTTNGFVNEFYDISYTKNRNDFFSSPTGMPPISNVGAFNSLDTNPIIKPDYFNGISPISGTGDTIGIEFWIKGADNTLGVAIPAFIRGWSNLVSCGVTINNGTVYAYLDGVETQVSMLNILNAGVYNHIFVSYEQYLGSFAVKCYINGENFTLGGVPISGKAVAGLHQEASSIGCYTYDGTHMDVTKPRFQPTHEIAMIRYYDNDTLSLTGQIPYLYKASRDRFIL
jgi:hypothetical protein